MTLNSQWSTTARNDRLAALATAAQGGSLKIYTGAQPANGDAALTGTLLASLAFDTTEFSTPSAGAMSNADIWTATASATGTAGYCAIVASDGTTVLWMGSVGTSGCNLNLATTAISSGVTVSIASGGFTVNDQAAISGL